MKQIIAVNTICDMCGKTDKEFKPPTNLYCFTSSEVRISFELEGKYVDEGDLNVFTPLKLDLCGECTMKLRLLILNCMKGNKYEW